jgi:tRNA (cytidine/uridine-2'-O-)-methyltransferase
MEPDFGAGLEQGVNFHVVLVEPEIPQNTGSIARMCAGTGAWLHLVEPLGYILEDRYLKRAGLDYWPSVRLSVHRSWEEAAALLPWERTWLLSARASARYWDAPMAGGDVLVFGRESTGLSAELLASRGERTIGLPLSPSIRSFNVSTAVGVAGFEILRRINWRG